MRVLYVWTHKKAKEVDTRMHKSGQNLETESVQLAQTMYQVCSKGRVKECLLGLPADF